MSKESREHLSTLTVKELRELAKSLPGVSGIHSMKKDELVSLLLEHGATPDSGQPSSGQPEPKEKTKRAPQKQARKEPPTKAELKAMIREMSAQKESAREQGDRGLVTQLRRRINRLRKRTRKTG